MTFRNTAYHRILSGILVLVMVFTMTAELIQPAVAAAPTIQLKKISNIYDGSIYVTGTLKCSRADKINAYGLLYGENSPEENKAVISSTKGKTYTGTKSISTTVSGMTPGKNYVCCLYAETTGGTIYKSETMAFTSSSISVAQPQVNNITYNSAKISAVYTKTGSCPVKEVGFYYGTDKNCTKKIKASKSTKITKQLQSLESGRTYYYYAYVLSEAGNLYKSEIQTFQTISRSATGVTLRTSVGSVSSWKDNPKEKSVHLYDEFHIEAEIRPDYAQNKNVTFSTSDPSVLQIGKSRVKAVAPGQATLTATTEDGGITASLLITVKDRPDWDEVPVITSVRADGENSVTLKWKRPSCFWPDEKVIYIVYRADKRNGNYKEVERTTQTSTTDDTLDPDTTYFYKIQAYEKSDDLYQFTYFSDVVSVTTKEHVYVSKNKKEETSENDNVIAPDPVEVIPFPDTGSNIIAPDPVQPQTDLAPQVSGLAAAYTIEKGGKLSLRFTVEDAANGVVEKVTVKHNVTNSTCSASLTNSKNGGLECKFDITNSLFNKVGTYNFNVYAKTTNFTVTDNRIGSFTVTVVDKACQHQKYDDVYNRTEYTNIILTDAKHTSYVVYDRTCKDCGVHLGEINGKTQTTGHTVNKKGYCDCGYMDVSGYTPEKAYNKTGSTQNVYRNPESRGRYGSINANENVTILGEWGDRYLIEYSLDGGGVKQGWVDKSCISVDNIIDVYFNKVKIENTFLSSTGEYYVPLLEAVSAVKGTYSVQASSKYRIQKIYNPIKNLNYSATVDLSDKDGSNVIFNAKTPVTVWCKKVDNVVYVNLKDFAEDICGFHQVQNSADVIAYETDITSLNTIHNTAFVNSLNTYDNNFYCLGKTIYHEQLEGLRMGALKVVGTFSDISLGGLLGKVENLVADAYATVEGITSDACEALVKLWVPDNDVKFNIELRKACVVFYDEYRYATILKIIEAKEDITAKQLKDFDDLMDKDILNSPSVKIMECALTALEYLMNRIPKEQADDFAEFFNDLFKDTIPKFLSFENTEGKYKVNSKAFDMLSTVGNVALPLIKTVRTLYVYYTNQETVSYLKQLRTEISDIGLHGEVACLNLIIRRCESLPDFILTTGTEIGMEFLTSAIAKIFPEGSILDLVNMGLDGIGNTEAIKSSAFRLEIMSNVLDAVIQKKNKSAEAYLNDSSDTNLCNFLYDEYMYSILSIRCNEFGQELVDDNDKSIITAFRRLWNTKLYTPEAYREDKILDNQYYTMVCKDCMKRIRGLSD